MSPKKRKAEDIEFPDLGGDLLEDELLSQPLGVPDDDFDTVVAARKDHRGRNARQGSGPHGNEAGQLHEPGAGFRGSLGRRRRALGSDVRDRIELGSQCPGGGAPALPLLADQRRGDISLEPIEEVSSFGFQVSSCLSAMRQKILKVGT